MSLLVLSPLIIPRKPPAVDAEQQLLTDVRPFVLPLQQEFLVAMRAVVLLLARVRPELVHLQLLHPREPLLAGL